MNLLNNAVRLRIQGCPFLPGGIHLCEVQSHLVVLLLTAQTVHRLLLPHPARLYRSVSAGNAAGAGAGDPDTTGRAGEGVGDPKYSGNKRKSGGLGNSAVFCSGTGWVFRLCHVDCGDTRGAGWFCLGWNLFHVADGS